MATLHIRSVPDDLYEQLRTLAYSRQRSISAQVIALLERALLSEAQQEQQAQVLAEIRRRLLVLPVHTPDSTELLREDRSR